MNWIADTIAAFGRSIGLSGLALDDEGRMRLALPNGGLLGLLDMNDAQPPEMLVYRSEPLHHAHTRKLKRALRLPDFRQPRAVPLQVGVLDGELYLALRVPERGFTLDALERAWAELSELHASLDGRA